MARLIYIFFCLFVITLLVAILLPLPKKQRFIAHFYLSKILARLLRLKIKVTGKASKNTPILFVCNHISYLDIPLLSAVLNAKFVSKAEVSKWPILGWIANLTGTVFIERKKSAAGLHLQQIEDALFQDKKSLVIFPEGTTTDGRGVLPFKSSLFKIAENLPTGEKLTIQPVTISYTHINGLPVQANERKKIAWVGDASFTPHFKEFLQLGFIRANVVIHPPIEHYTNRKDLAEICQKAVESGL